MKGLVCFDYDGTLVDERDHIFTPTNKTRQAIASLQEEGYLCVLATGRAQSYIPKGAKDLYLDGYITSNGAVANMHGKEIHREVFCDEELKILLKEYEEHGFNYILENSSLCYVKDMQDSEYTHFMENFHVPNDNYVPYQTFEQVSGRVEKMTLLFSSEKAMKEYAKQLEGRYLVSFHRNCHTFDIAKCNINKGVGVKAVMEHYHIPQEDTYAFGDGDNDLELLSVVKHGIAMRIHDSKLDGIASMVTGTVKEEGIYTALKKLEVI